MASEDIASHQRNVSQFCPDCVSELNTPGIYATGSNLVFISKSSGLLESNAAFGWDINEGLLMSKKIYPFEIKS